MSSSLPPHPCLINSPFISSTPQALSFFFSSLAFLLSNDQFFPLINAYQNQNSNFNFNSNFNGQQTQPQQQQDQQEQIQSPKPIINITPPSPSTHSHTTASASENSTTEFDIKSNSSSNSAKQYPIKSSPSKPHFTIREITPIIELSPFNTEFRFEEKSVSAFASAVKDFSPNSSSKTVSFATDPIVKRHSFKSPIKTPHVITNKQSFANLISNLELYHDDADSKLNSELAIITHNKKSHNSEDLSTLETKYNDDNINDINNPLSTKAVNSEIVMQTTDSHSDSELEVKSENLIRSEVNNFQTHIFKRPKLGKIKHYFEHNFPNKPAICTTCYKFPCFIKPLTSTDLQRKEEIQQDTEPSCSIVYNWETNTKIIKNCLHCLYFASNNYFIPIDSDFRDPTYLTKLTAEYHKYYTHPNFIYSPPNNSDLQFDLSDIPLICNNNSINNHPLDPISVFFIIAPDSYVDIFIDHNPDFNPEYIAQTINSTNHNQLTHSMCGPHTSAGPQ